MTLLCYYNGGILSTRTAGKSLAKCIYGLRLFYVRHVNDESKFLNSIKINPRVGGVFLQKLNEASLVSAAVVCDNLVLLAVLEEF